GAAGSGGRRRLPAGGQGARIPAVLGGRNPRAVGGRAHGRARSVAGLAEGRHHCRCDPGGAARGQRIPARCALPRRRHARRPGGRRRVSRRVVRTRLSCMAGPGDMLPVAFWLVPSEPRRAALAELITALGAAHQGPAFEPHITLEVNHARGDLSLEALLDRVAAAFDPMTLVAGETAHSEIHFKTLYVEFDDPRLFALQRALREQIDRDRKSVV